MKNSVLLTLSLLVGAFAGFTSHAEDELKAGIPDQTVIVSTDRYDVTAADVKQFLSTSLSTGYWSNVSIVQVGSIEDKAMGALADIGTVFNKGISLFKKADTTFVGAVITVQARAHWDLDSNKNPKPYGEDKAPTPEMLTCDLLVEYNVKGATPTKSDMISFDCRRHVNPHSMFTLKGTINPHPLHAYIPAATLVDKKTN